MMREFLLDMIRFFVFIPMLAISYMPMKNQLKFSGIKIISLLCIPYCVFIPIALLIRVLFNSHIYMVMYIILALLFFAFFNTTVKTDMARSLATYMFGCEVAVFPANFAFTFDAYLHPTGVYTVFSVEAALFQLALTVLIVLIVIYPLRKYASRLVDSILPPSVWYAIMSVSLIFLVLNIAIVPHEYSTLHIGKSFPLYIAILSVLLLLMVILYIAFYLIATGVLKKAELTERIQFFEMQERQYKLQKEYIKETSKQRHDFRQSIFTLKQLADENDLTSLKNYLSDYVNALPKTEIVQYCSNNALNALLNYYAHSAAEHGIELQWNIELPDTITVSEPDLCSLFGNLIENAFAGCNTLEEGKRYHCLSVTVRNNINLYIVSTNNFDGFVKIKNNRYISTKRTGGGIGIRSVNMICEKYNGNAHFHHKGNEFYADVMLTLV